MTTVWNSVALPDPVGWDDAEDYVGTQRRWADGSLNNDTMATKRRVALRWENLTKPQRDGIYTLATAFASTTLLLPWGDTWSVTPVTNTFAADHSGGASSRWNVSVTVRLV